MFFARCVFRVKAGVNDLKQALEVLVNVGSVFAGGAKRGLFEVAERLEAVAEAVTLLVDRQDLQLSPTGLGIETEQEPIDEGEGFVFQVLGGDFEAAVVELGQVNAGQVPVRAQFFRTQLREVQLPSFGAVISPVVDEE